MNEITRRMTKPVRIRRPDITAITMIAHWGITALLLVVESAWINTCIMPYNLITKSLFCLGRVSVLYHAALSDGRVLLITEIENTPSFLYHREAWSSLPQRSSAIVKTGWFHYHRQKPGLESINTTHYLGSHTAQTLPRDAKAKQWLLLGKRRHGKSCGNKQVYAHSNSHCTWTMGLVQYIWCQAA